MRAQVTRCFVLGFLGLGGAGNPPEEAGEIQQIGIESEAGPVIVQLAPRARDIDAPLPLRGQALQAPRQLSTGDEKTQTQTQVNREARAVRPPSQLYDGGKTARAPDPLSEPAQGRTASVTPVEGTDLCDTASAMRQGLRSCSRVIESRSAEFIRPEPVSLSPEQRLLVEKRLRDAPANSRNAARRLGGSSTDNSIETQGVASVMLGMSRVGEERPVAAEDQQAVEAAAIVNAIINGGSGSPRPQP